SLEIGYFSQKLAQLNPENTVLQELKYFREELPEETIRTFLGAMLFPGEEVFKNIGDLSTGEKVRVSFTKLLLSKSNLLVLDEPLNHLDITSREKIEEALVNYPATILFVSHDRYFIKKTASHIWELTGNGLNCFQGKYDEYKKYKKRDRKSKQNKVKDDLVLQMRRAELTSRLEQVKNEEEKKKIEEKLNKLNQD
ncbi:MAG: ATP-binding cassette domain-containing protein, partial [bacterium]